MRHHSALLPLVAAAALLLTGCGPTTEDIQALVDGKEKDTYADALELREDVLDAGVGCAGAQQEVDVTGEPGSTAIQCDETMILAVSGNQEQHDMIVANFRDMSGVYYLQAGNWVVGSALTYPLERIQEELGGTITSPGS
jgi:hypothetical protein